MRWFRKRLSVNSHTHPHTHTPWRLANRLLLFTVLALATSSCTTPDAISGRGVYNFYSIEQEVELGQETIAANTKQLEEKGVQINADPARVSQLNTIVERIAAVSDMPDLPYAVTLYHTNIVNAAAAPGGQMFVFSGLYDAEKGLARTEEELAAVMAHEIAHVNARHSTERLSKILTAAAVFEVGAAVLEASDEDGWATGLRAAFAVGTVLYVPMHSRKDEFEADRVGLFYMAKAGYDPRAAPEIWRRVAEEQEEEHDSASIFSTHPSSWDRYETLAKMLPYAMDEYARATGTYPSDYRPPEGYAQGMEYNWRSPEE